MKRKTHMRDIRLFVNAGMSFPLCHADAEYLDLDKERLFTTNRKEDVTCKNCKKKLGIKNYLTKNVEFAKRYSTHVENPKQ